MSKKKKILIYGIGSLQNRGCEALVNSTISQIDSDVELTAATFDYEHDKNMYRDRIKKIVNHYRQDEKQFTSKEKELYELYKKMPFDYNNYELLYQRDVVKEMKNSDLCIHIGGDNYCYGVNEWMYALNTEAKKLGKKTVLWGASLFDEIKDLELIEDLKKYDLLMLREKISYNAIKDYIEEEKLMLIPDPAFSLEPKEVEMSKWYKDKKIIGLNLSPLTVKTEKNKEAIKKFINYILKNTSYSIALLPHVTVEEASDLTILFEVKKMFKNEIRVFLDDGVYNCQEIKYIIYHCDIMIAARTHASIAAYSTLVPTLVIGYSVKSRGIAEDIFGNYQEYVLSCDELKDNALIEKFKYIDDNKAEIKAILESRMTEIKQEARTLYSKMIERLDYLDKKSVCQKEKCTGCSACLNSCPTGAISFTKNQEGFYYPEIDLSKCIHCNKCRKVCCINNVNNYKQDKKQLLCYAAKAKDIDVKKKSSSGGIFHYLAGYIIKHEGIVYGATMNNFKVEHMRIDTIDELDRIQGSKYSQSNLKDTFKQVKHDLDDNKKVLFSGTPCQVLGLKNYLHKDYKNLYTVSVICHGVMNNDIVRKKIDEFEKQYETKMKNLVYHSKVNGWDNTSIEYQSERINKSYSVMEDSLMNLYINNYILRESCYNCPAKGLDNNLADIVLGDYWGIYHVHREMFDSLGVSAIIIKTTKGQNLFKKVEKNLVLEKTKYDEIIKYNPSFHTSMNKPLLRYKIFFDINRNELKTIVDNINLKQQLVQIQEQNKNTINKLESENANLYQELNKIYNSKRYQMANRIGNIISKIKH